MPKVRELPLLHAAAYIFVHTSRDIKKIASLVGVSERTIRRYAETEEWHHALDVFKYTGDRSFNTQPTRDVKRLRKYETAKDVYIKEYRAGTPKHKLATVTAIRLPDLQPRTIRLWAKKYNWNKSLTENRNVNTNHNKEQLPMLNVENRTIFEGDNLHILRGFDSETIDLIYLDPPFNSNRTYEAPIESDTEGNAFKDSWTLNDLDNAYHGELAEHDPGLYAAISVSEFTHGKPMKAYLVMMGIRLLEMKRILKPTGSIYLHCDPTASHYLKIMMDSVFGVKNFRNEIVWGYKWGGVSKKQFAKKHDIILYYSKTNKWTFNHQFSREVDTKTSERRHNNEKGKLLRDVWDDIPTLNALAKERLGYPTQKPITLLERIIKASSNENDIVLDPFCGCATTCIASERLRRRWIGIDLSPKSIELVKSRLDTDVLLTEMGDLFRNKVVHRTDPPVRSLQETPHQIQVDTLFRMPTDTEKALSQIELCQYKVHKHTLFGLQEGKCIGCHALFSFRNMTIDHIIPKTKGGTDDPDNLQLLCAACNSTKNTRSQDEFIDVLKKQGVR